jgi:hypothetical protein
MVRLALPLNLISVKSSDPEGKRPEARVRMERGLPADPTQMPREVFRQVRNKRSWRAVWPRSGADSPPNGPGSALPSDDP